MGSRGLNGKSKHEKIGPPQRSSPTETQCAFLTHERSAAPSCRVARGGVISLDPPPPDTTAEPGGNQIVPDSHPLRVTQHTPLVFALHYFSPTHLPFTGGNAGKHTPVFPLAGGIGSCTLVSPPHTCTHTHARMRARMHA